MGQKESVVVGMGVLSQIVEIGFKFVEDTEGRVTAGRMTEMDYSSWGLRTCCLRGISSVEGTATDSEF